MSERLTSASSSGTISFRHLTLREARPDAQSTGRVADGPQRQPTPAPRGTTAHATKALTPLLLLGATVTNRCSESNSMRIIFLFFTLFTLIGCTFLANEELKTAAKRGQVNLVKTLLSKGANVNYRSGSWTILMSVAKRGHTEVVKVLLRHGADVNAKGTGGDRAGGGMALSIAAEYGHVEIVRLLLAHGAEVNAKTNHGSTALMYAAEYGHPEVAKVLLQAGADVFPQDGDGETALMIVKRRSYAEIIHLLEKAGAKE